jgi:2-methylisocitrate lyase-like PEP mutase family enzyme
MAQRSGDHKEITMRTQGAETFAALHKAGAPLLLANAWDVASAVAIEAAGATAIATTSAGVAWSLGLRDAGGLDPQIAVAVVGRIAAAVSVPVSADIEAGYGDSPDAVAATVAAVVGAGAVGVNLEDRRDGASLYHIPEQAERLAAARAAAVLERAAAYKAAGADSLFVPGLTDLALIAELAAGPLPVAVMAWAGAPTVAELTAAGVVRISLGSAIAQAAYGLAARAATELFTNGTYDSTAGGIDYQTMNVARNRRRSRTGLILTRLAGRHYPFPGPGRFVSMIVDILPAAVSLDDLLGRA